MHLIAECAALTRALGACREIADTKSTIAVLGSTKLSLAGNTLSLESTDLTMKFTTSIQVDGRADGVAVLSAARIFEIIKALPTGAQVELKPAPSQGEVSGFTLLSGRSRYRLPALDPREWTEFPDITDGQEFILPAETLSRLLSLTAPFLMTEGAVSTLWGHFIHRSGALLRMAGCNRHILCSVGIPAPEGTEHFSGIVVPPRVARSIGGLITDDVTITIGETLMSFAWGESVLTSKMIEGGYPEYERLIPRDNPINIILGSSETIAAIKRAAMISDASEYAGTRAVRIVSQPDSEALMILAQGNNGEEGEEYAHALCSAAGEWGFNSRYLITALHACGGDNATAWLPAESTDPVLIKPDRDGEITIIVTPMALKQIGE